MIEASLIEKIKDLLEDIPQIKEVIAHPMDSSERIASYPAVVFYEDNDVQEFSDSGSNHRTLRFKLIAMIDANNITNAKLFEEVLPNVSDALFDEIDGSWDLGTEGGHRVWARLSDGIVGLTTEDKSKVAWKEFSLIVRFDKSI